MSDPSPLPDTTPRGLGMPTITPVVGTAYVEVVPSPAWERELRAALQYLLREHWLTQIECDHEAGTDTARCFCTIWTGAAQSSVKEAVEEWIAHVLDQFLVPPSLRSPAVPRNEASDNVR
jgi:hypothetical protein